MHLLPLTILYQQRRQILAILQCLFSLRDEFSHESLLPHIATVRFPGLSLSSLSVLVQVGHCCLAEAPERELNLLNLLKVIIRVAYLLLSCLLSVDVDGCLLE